jgi:hypothetical protein
LLLIVIETWLLKLFFLGLDDDDSSSWCSSLHFLMI